MNRAGGSVAPLADLTVAVTRVRNQAASLVVALEEQGARVAVCPLIRIGEPADAAAVHACAAHIAEYDGIVFTSVNAVQRLAAALAAVGGKPRRDAHVAVVGPATAEAAAAAGFAATIMPDRATGDALAAAVAARVDLRGRRVLFPRARDARRLVPEALAALGARVDEVECYRTLPDPDGAAALAALLKTRTVTVLTFTSPSQISAFVDALGAGAAAATRVAVIGPVTAAAARAVGMTVDVAAEPHTVDGLVKALCRHFASSDASRRAVDGGAAHG